ncbi:MAG: pyruvate, phosphate dikinase [Betaproteobacteria bacterium]|nr:pyruvate, phosphate dikinase [Betaproteobacteria bacterium]
MPKGKNKTAARLAIFDLNGRDGVPDAQLAGFKAHNLIRMAALGLPVPQGFVMGTDWCGAVRSGDGVRSHLSEALQAGIRDLERASGLGFGSARRPLLVSVRSGAPVSMPGMMETVLNVGLNDVSLAGMLRLTGDHRLVWDSYRRLIQAFAEIVAGVPAAPFEAALDATLRRTGADTARQLDFRALRDLARTYLVLYGDHTGQAFPQDPFEQLAAATRAVFASWMSEKAVEYRRLNNLPDNLGTAVTVQRMVFGNAGGNSGAGVGFTRDPSNGENRLYIDWLQQAQGEDIVSGRRRVAAEDDVPAWLTRKLALVGESLENAFRDAQEFEFTVENGELFMLQTRTAKRTALASLRIAVDQVESGLINPEVALNRLSGIDIDNLILRHVDSATPPLGRAIPAGTGVAQGPAAFSIKTALAFAERGTPAILVRNDVATSDIAGIAVVSGVLTASGGRTSHAAVVARQMGKVCLVGCTDLHIDEHAAQAMLGQNRIFEGDALCLDGDAGTIYADSPKIGTERPEALIARVRAWQTPPLDHP